MYNLKVISSNDMKVINRCEEIVNDNDFINGRIFQNVGLCNQASFLVCVLEESNIIGFAALFENFILRENLHIAQLAVDTKFLNKGIEEIILKFILKHSNQYKNITTDLKNKQDEHLKLYKTLGFKVLFDVGFNTRLIVDTHDLAETLNMNFNSQNEFNF